MGIKTYEIVLTCDRDGQLMMRTSDDADPRRTVHGIRACEQTFDRLAISTLRSYATCKKTTGDDE